MDGGRWGKEASDEASIPVSVGFHPVFVFVFEGHLAFILTHVLF